MYRTPKIEDLIVILERYSCSNDWKGTIEIMNNGMIKMVKPRYKDLYIPIGYIGYVGDFYTFFSK